MDAFQGARARLDTFHALASRVWMKTISLTDEADQRLKSWKTEPSESLSKVVLKAVPERGTAADMEQGFKWLPGPDPEAVGSHGCVAGLGQ